MSVFHPRARKAFWSSSSGSDRLPTTRAVGLTVGIPKRQADKPQGPKDDLDNLMDALDALDL